jgi:cytochrome b involved in lipid metabolism
MNTQKAVVLGVVGALFVGGLGYIVWSGRPVMNLDNLPPSTTVPTTPVTPPAEADVVTKDPDTSPDDEVGKGEVTTPEDANPPAKETLTFSLAEVAAHNTPENCWSTINGSVYDLTTWVSRHPGGPGAIKRLCGADGSAAFTAKHGGSSGAQAALVLLKIGTLE